MKIFLIILSLSGLLLFIFGSWGRFSQAGRAKYDEMAGIIPMACFFLGIVLLIVALIIFTVRSRS